jgi:hypothetical protein
MKFDPTEGDLREIRFPVPDFSDVVGVWQRPIGSIRDIDRRPDARETDFELEAGAGVWRVL